MCGIVGLFLKNRALEAELGAHLAPMLVEMTERGPDSAGFAVYGAEVPEGATKFTLYHPDADFPWEELAAAMARELSAEVEIARRWNHAVIRIGLTEEPAGEWLGATHPEIQIMGVGRKMEVFKDRGPPAEIVEHFGLATMAGSHGIGHTRMATESAVTTEHSHPFAAGADICLVHNGSLSNHNRLREWLKRRGMRFLTDNDTEVAARYVAYRLREGAGLKGSLEAAIRDLDGFYTLCVGTRTGFAVLRDAIAAKPAVMAETDDWVAMASEYRSIAHLPGAERAAVWEPKPRTVYSWTLALKEAA